MFSILVTEPGFEPRDHRNRSWASFLVTASKHSYFSNSVNRNLPFCVQQRLEGGGTHKHTNKQSHSLPLLEACFWASPRLHDQMHPHLVGAYNSSMGEAKSFSWFNNLDTATLNHMGSEMVHPDSNSDLFYSEHSFHASGSQGGHFGTLRTVSNVCRHFCFSHLGSCYWNQVSIDWGCCLTPCNAYDSCYNKQLSGFQCQWWWGRENLL